MIELNLSASARQLDIHLPYTWPTALTSYSTSSIQFQSSSKVRVQVVPLIPKPWHHVRLPVKNCISLLYTEFIRNSTVPQRTPVDTGNSKLKSPLLPALSGSTSTYAAYTASSTRFAICFQANVNLLIPCYPSTAHFVALGLLPCGPSVYRQ